MVRQRTAKAASRQSVVCDTLIPTFHQRLRQRDRGARHELHRPGASGVNVGLLDMSTQATAYARLVGVPSAGTGAGTASITCASIAMPRVAAGNSAGSLLFNKVNSRVSAALAACGSPMPLSATALALTPAQVSLIAGWIDAGALND